MQTQLSDPPQGNLPVWTLCWGPPGCHDAPGQLDQAWSNAQPQRYLRGLQPNQAAFSFPRGAEGLGQLLKILMARSGLTWRAVPWSRAFSVFCPPKPGLAPPGPWPEFLPCRLLPGEWGL